MCIIMKDQADKSWLAPEQPLSEAEQEQAADCIICRLFTAAALFALVATGILVSSIPDSNAATDKHDIIISSEQHDTLISDDLSDYLQKQGHGLVIDEMDAE